MGWSKYTTSVDIWAVGCVRLLRKISFKQLTYSAILQILAELIGR